MKTLKLFLILMLVLTAALYAAANKRVISTTVVGDWNQSATRSSSGIYNAIGTVKFTLEYDSATAAAWDSDTLVCIAVLPTKGYANLQAWSYALTQTGDSAFGSGAAGDSLIALNQTSYNKDTWFTLSGRDNDTVQTTLLTDVCQLTQYSAAGDSATKVFGDYYRLYYISRGNCGALSTAKDTATVTIRFGVRMW